MGLNYCAWFGLAAGHPACDVALAWCRPAKLHYAD